MNIQKTGPGIFKGIEYQLMGKVLMPDNLLMEDENGNPILNEDGEQEMESVQGSTEYIADALFNKDNGFVLPFEIASVLLLAALIGAIVVVRNKDGT